MIRTDDTDIASYLAKGLPSPDALLLALQQQLGRNTELQNQLNQKAEVIEGKDLYIESSQEQLRLAFAQRFGKSSEKTDPNQRDLFNEAEFLAEQPAPEEIDEEEIDASSGPRKKKKGRKGLNLDLPREYIKHELSAEERAGATDTFFTKVKEELHLVPAKAYVREHWQEKAVFKINGKREIVAAQRPKHPLGKCIASVELLAWIIVSKYTDALPLYRLESILKRCGGEISRTAMAHWIIRLSEQLQPLLKVLYAQQMKANYLQGDETRIQVLKEPGKSPTGNKQMWILRAEHTGCGPPGKPVITFHYDPSRSSAVVERLLEDFEGRYFQCDGYSAYSKTCVEKELVQLGCWDHARRKFKDAEKALPKKKKAGAPAKCTMALSLINKLYSIERNIKELPADEKHEQRQKLSAPALDKLHDWLQSNVDKTPKYSKTGTAIRYTLNQWDKLSNYTQHEELHISNVLAENAIRPFVIGRKNWLFADTPKGVHASACFYSLIETAKANGVEPYGHLKHVIGNMANAETVENLEALLPWNMP